MGPNTKIYKILKLSLVLNLSFSGLISRLLTSGKEREEVRVAHINVRPLIFFLTKETCQS